MKRKIASLLMVSILAVCLLSGCGDNKAKDTEAPIEDEIEAPVEEEEAPEEEAPPEDEVVEEPEELEKERRLLAVITHDSSGVYVSKEYLYSEAGVVEQELLYFADDVSCASSAYECDSKGNIIRDTWTNAVEAEGIGRWTDYTYDDAGNLIKETKCDSDGSIFGWTVYVYDMDGHILREENYDSDGKRMGYIEYEYSDAYDTARAVWYDFYSDGRTKFDEYEYDAEGNIIRYINYDWGGSLSYSIVYEYDEEGNMLKESHFDSSGNILVWQDYVYADIQPGIEIEYPPLGNDFTSWDTYNTILIVNGYSPEYAGELQEIIEEEYFLNPDLKNYYAVYEYLKVVYINLPYKNPHFAIWPLSLYKEVYNEELGITIDPDELLEDENVFVDWLYYNEEQQ